MSNYKGFKDIFHNKDLRVSFEVKTQCCIEIRDYDENEFYWVYLGKNDAAALRDELTNLLKLME